MLSIALELAREDDRYEDVASKFWEHFVHIASAMNTLGMWDEEDGFYYDLLHHPGQDEMCLKIRSMVGLIPIFAVESFPPELLARFPDFLRRLEWFIDHRPDIAAGGACMRAPGGEGGRVFSLAGPPKRPRVPPPRLGASEGLSPHGPRAPSR